MAAQDAQDMFDSLIGFVLQGYTNFLNNLKAFIHMSGLQWIRIITIIGAYLLLRPYLTKIATAGAAKKQAEAMNDEDVVQRRKDRELREMNIITPNILRGVSDKKIELPMESDSEGEKATGKDAKWGGKARKRQRLLVRKIVEQEERARREARDVGGFVSDEDKDIAEYLT